MNINLHSEGKNDFTRSLKKKLDKKISEVKNSKKLSIKNIKIEINTLRKEYLKRIKESKYSNF